MYGLELALRIESTTVFYTPAVAMKAPGTVFRGRRFVVRVQLIVVFCCVDKNTLCRRYITKNAAVQFSFVRVFVGKIYIYIYMFLKPRRTTITAVRYGPTLKFLCR